MRRATGSYGRPLRLAAVWMLLGAVYLLFVGSFGWSEALAGAASASLGTIWWDRAARRGRVRFDIGIAAARPLADAILGLPRKTGRVGMSLIRSAASGRRLGAVDRRPVAEIPWASAKGAAAPAVRAIGLFSASLAPDGYVLDLDAGGGEVIRHVLAEEAAA